MQIQVARISPVVLELAVEIPADAVKAHVEKAYANLQRKARVRGFRPGKAPRHVLAQLFGPQVASDVAQAIVNDTLPKAMGEKQITPISQPQVEAGKLEQTAAFSYKARFEVQPEIDSVVYEGFELSRPSAEATDAMVDEQIELLRKQHARLETPEPARAAQKGDVVTIDFTLSIDGKEVKEGGGQGVPVELGSGQALAELDAAITGKKVDDSFDVDAKFPDNAARAELRGKTGAFRVKVKEIKQRILPALDDELAKDVGNFQTLVELRAGVHTRLQKMVKDRSDTALAEQIVAKLNDKNACEVPPSLVEQQCRLMEMEILQNARRMGHKPTQEELASVHDRVHADAEKKVRAGLLMAAIAKKAGIQVSDSDIQKGLEELAQETGKNVAKVRAEYNDPQRRNLLVGMILEDKVLDLIESKAKITEGQPQQPQEQPQEKEESQKPAPKAKKSSARPQGADAHEKKASEGKK